MTFKEFIQLTEAPEGVVGGGSEHGLMIDKKWPTSFHSPSMGWRPTSAARLGLGGGSGEYSGGTGPASGPPAMMRKNMRKMKKR